MGKVNGCLKCLFIFFNIVFAVVGCLLIFGAVRSTVVSSQLSTVGAPGIGWGWVFAIGVLVISCLGIYAGFSEKELALKIFAGFMVAGMIIMLIFGIYVAVTKNKIRDMLTNATSDVAKTYMQDDDFRAMISGIQSTMDCCGLSSAEDWGSEIPVSCACVGSSGGYGGYGGFASFGMGSGECKARPKGTTGPDQVYATPCGEHLFYVINLVLTISMGILFGFAVTALLGLLVTLLMLYQIRRHEGGGPVVSMKNY